MQNTLHFGSKFDGNCHHEIGSGQFLGERNLLHFLETHLGLAGYPSNTDYLRIEIFRQALQQNLEIEPTAFFAQSFEADRFATATALLEWRDELLLAGWDFVCHSERICPPRLKTLAEVEIFFRKKLSKPPASVEAFGFADRFSQVFEKIKTRDLPFEKLVLHEPEHLLSVHIQRLIHIFREKNIQTEQAAPLVPISENTNLAHLQKRLLGQTTEKKPGENDGSLFILRAKRDADAATFLAQTLRANPKLQPVFLVPEMSLTLEQAIVREGFPAMGILSASLARPSLQALKLAPVFLWEPVDVFKIMEFASLPVKPLEDGLSAKIAEVLAAKPGLFNDTWFAVIFGYLEDGNTPEEARKNYDFWFDRRRHRSDSTAPKREIIGIYSHLHDWARDNFEKTSNQTLLVLAEQSRRIRDLLNAIPETQLSFLELERIVRTIYQPSPVQFNDPERRHFAFAHAPGALATTADVLIWWNCIHNEPAPAAPRWQPSELQFLENQGVKIIFPKQKNELRLLLRNRAVLAAQEKLILVVPENVDGSPVEPHLLLGDIEASFEKCSDFTFQIDDENSRAALAQMLRMPETAQIPSRAGHRTPPQLPFLNPENLQENEYETLTNLDSLFYYPHQWFFRKKLRLFPASILSVVADRTLIGNLAHRFFELMLKEDFQNWERRDVSDWLDERATNLLEREGATLLMYGREPERNRFLNRLKNAAWTLISLLRKNSWQVLATEMDLEGTFCDVPVRGKADLVLGRGNERAILDLKWGGANYRKGLIKNGADLQLVFYSKLLPPDTVWAHTGYFILEDSKLIARNNLAFAEAQIAGAGEDHFSANELIFNKMEKTFRWRMEQIRSGNLEIRTRENLSFLEEMYAEQLLELLELPSDSSKFDHYRALVEG